MSGTTEPVEESSGGEERHCPICGARTRPFGRAVVLDDVNASFSRCPSCWAVVADEPTWLEHAYTDAIARHDIGLISRNIQLAEDVSRTVMYCLPTATSFIDFGAGNGMFVRMMRDRGFDFRYFDPYGPNIFAECFEVVDAPSPGADVITALEVVEHLRDPIAELSPFVRNSDLLLVSTTLVAEEAPPLDSWWYYSLSSGQHITLLSARSLGILASALGFRVASFGTFHVLSREPINALRLRVTLRLPCLPQRRSRRGSLLETDYEQLFGQRLM